MTRAATEAEILSLYGDGAGTGVADSAQNRARAVPDRPTDEDPTTDELADQFGAVAAAAALAAQRQRVLVAFADGTELTVEVDGRDMRQVRLLRKRLGIPDDLDPADPFDTAYLYTVWAWWAARHRHRSTTLTWAEWDAAAVGVTLDLRTAPVDPFAPAPLTG